MLRQRKIYILSFVILQYTILFSCVPEQNSTGHRELAKELFQIPIFIGSNFNEINKVHFQNVEFDNPNYGGLTAYFNGQRDYHIFDSVTRGGYMFYLKKSRVDGFSLDIPYNNKLFSLIDSVSILHLNSNQILKGNYVRKFDLKGEFTFRVYVVERAQFPSFYTGEKIIRISLFKGVS